MKVLCTDHADVDAPAETVFSFVTDISRWPVWFSPVVSAQHPDSLPVALDEELLLCLHCGRRRWHETFEVTRFVRSAFLSLEGAFSAARRIDFRFEQRGKQTRVAASIGYPVFGGPIKSAIDHLFQRRRVRRELRESLSRLKGMLEEQAESTVFGDESYDDASRGLQAAPNQSGAARVEQPAGAI
jgi:uncharacterized membrane protein